MLRLKFDIVILLVTSILYWVNVAFLRPRGIFIFVSYFNDLCCGLWFPAYVNFLLSFARKRIAKLSHLLAFMLFWGIVWEFVAPLINSRSTTDPVDLVCYLLGTVFYWGIYRFVNRIR